MNGKDRIVYKDLNESSAVRSACWLLYKIHKESKIVIREYFFAVNSIDNTINGERFAGLNFRIFRGFA